MTLVELQKMALWWWESEGVSTVVKNEWCLEEARSLGRAVLALAAAVTAIENGGLAGVCEAGCTLVPCVAAAVHRGYCCRQA
jgi:hypothetical protein